MNLLILLGLRYNLYKNFKFYFLQGENVQIFLIFTYNQGKILFILRITLGVHVYSPMGVGVLSSRSERNLKFKASAKESL